MLARAKIEGCFALVVEVEHQNMMGDDATRASLKTELLQHLEALGQQALFPSEQEPIDQIVQQLESINPIERPG